MDLGDFIEAMDVGDWIAVAALGATILIAIITFLYARKTLANQTLVDLMREYAAPEMGESLRNLYAFRDRCCEEKKLIKAKFEELMEREKGLPLKPIEELTEYEQKIIDEYRRVNSARRRVSHFLQAVAAFHKGGIIGDQLVFDSWAEPDLRIIPDIILPLEKAKQRDRMKGMDAQQKKEEMINEMALEALNTLYGKCNKYWDRKVWFRRIWSKCKRFWDNKVGKRQCRTDSTSSDAAK